MGASEGASVAPDLAVRGADALRVSDASVLPRRIAGIIGATAPMIRGKAADLTGIVRAWRLRGRSADRFRAAGENAAGASAAKLPQACMNPPLA